MEKSTARAERDIKKCDDNLRIDYYDINSKMKVVVNYENESSTTDTLNKNLKNLIKSIYKEKILG